MTTAVSFELAKLLKEKGFNLKVKQRWGIVENIDRDKTPFCQYDCGLFNWNNEKYADYISAPTIVDVIMWLYEKHGIWIRVTPIPYSENLTHWRWEHMSTNYTTRNVSWKKQKDYLSPTKAYEAAIEYTLNNLM